MHAYSTRTVFQSALALVVVVITALWWLTVPDMIATSTFVALCVVGAASVWVVVITRENARPTSSLAQSLHDETAAGVKRARQRAAEY